MSNTTNRPGVKTTEFWINAAMQAAGWGGLESGQIEFTDERLKLAAFVVLVVAGAFYSWLRTQQKSITTDILTTPPPPSPSNLPVIPLLLVLVLVLPLMLIGGCVSRDIHDAATILKVDFERYRMASVPHPHYGPVTATAVIQLGHNINKTISHIEELSR